MTEILPSFVLADLYPHSLVLVETGVQVQEIKPETNENVAGALIEPIFEKSLPLVLPEKWFFGNNAKNITILVNEPDAVYLSDQNLTS
jgi:hypothetical protein